MNDRPSIRGLLALVAVLAGLSVLVLAGPSARRSAESDTYSEIVRTHFIQRDLLKVRENLDDRSGVPIVDLADEAYGPQNDAVLRFAENSRLLSDIQRDDPSIWTIENGRVTGLANTKRAARLPFTGSAGWRGAIHYSQPLRTTPPRRLVMQAYPHGMAPALVFSGQALDLTTGDSRIRRVVLGQATPVAPAAEFEIYCTAQDSTYVVKLARVGDEIAVIAGESPCRAAREGAPLDRFDQTALSFGERLTIAAPDGRVLAAFFGARAQEQITTLSQPSPGGKRVRDPEAATIAAAMDTDYLNALPAGAQPALQEDFGVTLDMGLQRRVQRKLANFVAARRLPPGAVAAVTVMDARSGNLLALASYPATSDPDRVADRDDAAFRAASLNQNFALLPIGSVAKPLLAAAIYAERPSLATLRMRARTGAVPDVLGFRLSDPFTNHSDAEAGFTRGGFIGLDEFMRSSDNDFAATLLMLASADRDRRQLVALAPDDAYYLDGVLYSHRVKSLFERRAPDGRWVVSPPESSRQLAWADKLASLFDVNVNVPGARGAEGQLSRAGQACTSGGGDYGDDLHDMTPWRRLFRARPELEVCRVKRSALQREALGIAQARDFRTELLPIMFGNGEGRWSTIKVAEAYSRLVTGIKVRASLIQGPREADTRISPDFKARPALTHALTTVVSGTAANTELRPAVDALAADVRARGLALGTFAKTGTPEVTLLDYSSQDKALNLMMQRKRLILNRATGTAVFVDARGTRRAVANGDIERVAAAMRADPASADALRRFGVDARRAAAAIAAYNSEARAGQSPYVIREGLLVRMAARRPLGGLCGKRGGPTGKVVALVVGVYDPADDPSRRHVTSDLRVVDGVVVPRAAYSIVVSLQFPSCDHSANAAADLAGQILRDELAPRLRQVRPTARGAI